MKWQWITTPREFASELRHAVRGLRRAKVLTISATLVLALGIGAATTVASIVDTVLLRGLPYPHADRIAYLWQTFDADWTRRVNVSMPELRDYEERPRSLAAIGGFITTGTSLSDGEQPERVQVALVTRGVFDVLGTPPLLGRIFSPDEALVPFGVYGLLSERLWRRKFAADPNVIGRTVLMGGRQISIVGVMPAAFDFPRGVDVWRPLVQTGAVLSDRSRRFVDVIVRVKPEFTMVMASRDVHEAEQSHPDADIEGTRLVPLKEELVGNSRSVVLAVAGAVILVLLIACASVANLLLVRSAGRMRETAVRAALGASRAGLVRYVLAESVVLSLTGAVAGLALAHWALRLVAVFGPRNVPRLDSVALDWRVTLMSVALALFTALAAGLAPAMAQTRAGPAAALATSRTTGGVAGVRLRTGLVVVEIALALSLLVGALLLVRTMSNLRSVALGFQHEELLTLQVSLPFASYPEHQQRVSFFADLLRRTRALPGVVAAGATSILPINAENASSSTVTDANQVQGRFPEANTRTVSDGFFEALGMRLLEGRLYTASDGFPGSPRIVIINAALAERLWPGQSALGKRLSVHAPPDQPVWREVVGVVSDIRQMSLDGRPQIELYEPHAQVGDGTLALVIRTREAATAPVISSVRGVMRALDPNLPMYAVKTMEEHLGESVATRQFSAVLLSAFSLFAMILAALGLYGVIAYSVSQRARELGVRLALGAQRSAIAGLVLRSGLTVAGVGVAIGVAMALGLTRLLSALLYGVQSFDWASYVAVIATLMVLAALASWIPARRATLVDPVQTLRGD
jgi:predicted permease